MYHPFKLEKEDKQMIYVVGGFFLAVATLLGTINHYYSRKEVVSPIERTVESKRTPTIQIYPTVKIYKDRLPLPLNDGEGMVFEFIDLPPPLGILPGTLDKQALDELIKKHESELKLSNEFRSGNDNYIPLQDENLGLPK